MDDPPGPFVDDVATTPTSNTSRDGGNAGGRPGDMVFAIARYVLACWVGTGGLSFLPATAITHACCCRADGGLLLSSLLREASHGVVSLCGRGVATVVTIAAMTLVLVLLIIAQSVLMVVAERLGLAPIVVLLVTVVLALSHKMQVPLKALARVLIF